MTITAAAATAGARPAELYEKVDDGRLRLHFHPGQLRAWRSERRFIAVLAGTQSGKTSYGPAWLWREINRRGPGDYIAATASYDLFKLKMLPALREVFEDILRCGRYWAGDRVMEIADPATGEFLARRSTDPMWARIILRSAEAEGGLESSTAKAAWLDEAGQDSFRLGAWHAVLRRLSLTMGRVLLTTTLFNFGWLKAQVHDRWLAGDPDYEVVRFDSTENPQFPREEWERARASMPDWKFDLQYRGIYTRPAGLIYDCFRDAPAPLGHLVPRRPVPVDWPRLLCLDFGGVNTGAVYLANEPGTPRWYAYREYLAGNRTAKEHAKELLLGEPVVPTCVGGSKSEGQWRDEFRAAGLLVHGPDVSDVEIGIGRAYGAIKRGELYVVNDLAGLLGELRNYSRKLDSNGDPTEAIEDKAGFHRIDALRYGEVYIHRQPSGPRPSRHEPRSPVHGYRG